MQITKYGHSCVLLDDGTTKILFDPGSYSEVPDIAVDAIIITHVHQDHFHIDEVQKLLKNSAARIITNTEVGEELKKNNIEFEVVEDGNSTKVNTFDVKAVGNDHAIIHPTWPIAQNTGYLINDKIFHPGDSLVVPPSEIEVLLLPIVAPWSKISETLDYIAAVKPKACFPIHDGFLKTPGLFYGMANQWSAGHGAKFIEPELNKEYDI